jgi:hypothetical protein
MSTAGVAEALVALLVGCAVIVTTAACGAPEYTYIKNSSDRTYFKVPSSWRVIDEKALEQVSSGGSTPSQKSDRWAVAYDAADVPSPAHLVDKDTSEPIVYASVQQVPEAARAQVSLDTLRDLLLPVTPAAREGAAAGSATFTDFNLVEETVLTPQPGLRGVHEVFQYRVQKGPLQTFDKTAYMNSDASKVYVMLLRCSSECYKARRAELESMTASFTVQEGS